MSLLQQAGSIAEIRFDYDLVHSLRIDILKLLSGKDVTAGDGALAALLAVSSLLGDPDMTVETEADYMMAALEWTGAYFGAEEAN